MLNRFILLSIVILNDLIILTISFLEVGFFANIFGEQYSISNIFEGSIIYKADPISSISVDTSANLIA